MATTAVIAPTASGQDSSEFTVTTPVSVYLVTSTGLITETAKMQILKKVGTSTYTPFDAQSGRMRKRVAVFLNRAQQSYYLQDPGTYIVRKSPTTQLIGVSVDNQT